MAPFPPNIAAKIFAWILLNRLVPGAEMMIPVCQDGFRHCRDGLFFATAPGKESWAAKTTDIHLQGSPEGLRQSLNMAYSLPLWLYMSLVRMRHDRIYGRQNHQSVLKQGCVLASTLFYLYFAPMINDTRPRRDIRYRFICVLFNLARLRYRTNITTTRVREFQYYDDNLSADTTVINLQISENLYNEAYIRDANQC